jgi:hypothetical protein
MSLFKQLLAVLLGVVIGAVVIHPNTIKAQDPKDALRHEQGRIIVTPIGPKVQVTLDSTDRYLGFSCTQDQCYVATMD